MNFLSLRNELNSWTLDSDDKLYRAIKQLSETVIEAEKIILNNIQTTRYEINKGHVESGCSYNHYLMVSETKFTENKIGEKKPPAKPEGNTDKVELRTKMDIFKEAIEIGTRNLEITEDKNADNDLVSVSDISLSQSIYRDCRVPAYYGTKQFATNSFLGLFTDGELNAAIPSQKFETNQLALANQVHESLLPPPSLDQALAGSISASNFDLPPPPPSLQSLSLPPPPPPLTSILPAPPSFNPSMPQLSLPDISSLPPLPPMADKQVPSRDVQVEEIKAPPVQKPKGPLSMQQELALRLKHGKNYKQEVEVIVEQPVREETKPVRKEEIAEMKLPDITEQRESTDSVRNSMLRKSYGGLNLNPLVNPIGNVKPSYEEPEEEEVDSFFGPAKSKNKEVKKAITIQNDIMKRETFNQDILFKKKPVPEKKQAPKPKNNLFAEGSDEETSGFSFKKKQQRPKPVAAQKVSVVEVNEKPAPKKNLMGSDSEGDQGLNLFNKKPDTKPKPTSTAQAQQAPAPSSEKKTLNPLFQPSKKAQTVAVETKKENPLLIPEKKKQNPLLRAEQPEQNVDRTSSNMSHAESYAKKMAAAGGLGGMMGMPMLPKGMLLTKPSETKKSEQEALERLKKQQEEQRVAQEEERRRLEEQRQDERRRQEEMKAQQELRRVQQAEKQQKEVTVQTKIPVSQPTTQPKKPQSRNKMFNEDEDQQDFFKQKAAKGLPKLDPPAVVAQKKPILSSQAFKQQPPVEKQIVVQVKPAESKPPETGVNQLATRRKKEKPTKKSLFDSEQEQSGLSAKKVLPSLPKPTINENQSKRVRQEQQRRAKQQQEQEQERKRRQMEQQERMISQQEQENRKRQLGKIEAQNRRQQQEQQRQMEQQNKRQQEARKRTLRQEQERRQRELEEKRIRQQQLREQQRLIEQRQREQQRRRQQQQRVRIQEQARIAEQQRKRRQAAELARQEQERAQRQQQEKQRQRLEQQRKKAQESKKQPFLPKLPSRNQPLGGNVPSLPKVAGPLGTPKPPPNKSSLFNEDEEQQSMKVKAPKPNAPKPSATSLTGNQQKRGLFDDDDLDDNFLLSKKPAAKPKPEVSKTSKLFNGDDQDLGFQAKPKAPTNQPRPEPVKEAQKPIEKPNSKKLFEEQDEDLGFKAPSIKQPLAPPTKVQIKVQAKKPEQGKKSLFNDDDDDFGGNFLKKPAQSKPAPVAAPKTAQPAKQEFAPSVPSQKPSQRRNLFGDDDDDDGFLSKPPARKPAPVQPPSAPVKPVATTNQRKNLLDDSEDQQQQRRKREAAKKIRQFK